MRRAAFLFVVLSVPAFTFASGHGPLFGLATPTNSQGEWSFDEGIFGRAASGGLQASARTLIGYGFTPHLTLSLTLPVVVASATLPPTRIQPGADFDSTLAWRFQHRATKVGTRIESTAFASFVVPGSQSGFKGVANTSNVPGLMLGAVTGTASRSHYLWLGGTYTKFFEHNGDRRPGVLDYSLVYGYRPPKWRRPPDKWDWRLFAELVGERSQEFLQANSRVAGTQANQLFLGPRNLSQLHGQLRSPGPDLPGRGLTVPKRASALRRQFQLSAFSTHTLGESGEKNAFAVVPVAPVVPRDLCQRRDQIDRHHHFWHGLRGLCTRRARVFEGRSWCGFRRGEP